jgi:hypothetical protein
MGMLGFSLRASIPPSLISFSRAAFAASSALIGLEIGQQYAPFLAKKACPAGFARTLVGLPKPRKGRFSPFLLPC